MIDMETGNHVEYNSNLAYKLQSYNCARKPSGSSLIDANA